VHEIAVASSGASILLILSTRGFPEVCHRAEFYVDGTAVIEAPLQGLQCTRCGLFVAELDIHAAHHVICQVVAHVQVLNLAKLGQLLKHILIEVLKVLLACFGVHWQRQPIRANRSVQSRVLVHILQEQRLTDSGLVVQAGATVSMPAGSDLEVEGAVDTILFCTEDRGQVLSHGGVDTSPYSPCY
jgi:hypothetical protein